MTDWIIFLIAIAILFFGHFKKDYTSLLFSSIIFVVGGLKYVVLAKDTTGIAVIFFGAYIGIRASIELIVDVLNEIKGGSKWLKKRKAR